MIKLSKDKGPWHCWKICIILLWDIRHGINGGSGDPTLYLLNIGTAQTQNKELKEGFF